MDDFEKELKYDFLEEAATQLDDIEQAFLDLENGDKSAIDLIFRLAHNIKGTSKAVGFSQMSQFTHKLENLLLQLKNGELEINQERVSLLLRSTDQIRVMVHDLKQDLDASFDIEQICNELDQADTLSGENTAETATAEPSLEVKVETKASEPEPDVTPLFSQEEIEQSQIEQQAAVPQVTQPTPPPPLPKANETKSTPTKRASQDESLRVSMKKIEELNNYVGELVILQSIYEREVNGSNLGQLKSMTSQLNKLSKSIQTVSMSLRMVSMKNTLNKLQRVVRDTSTALGKTVELEIIGEETEIDKQVLEKLHEPLVHIVRNAVDHGLEENDQARLEQGKNAAGKIQVDCRHDGNSLVIEVRDDGKGIVAEKIREKAVEKGIISESTELETKDAINLIFHPGFSTKTEVSEVSGRGVGMDVVSSNIKELSGDIEIATEVGKGSCFTIRLPLTMAVIEGVVGLAGKNRFIFPLNQVYETLRPSSDQIRYVSGVGHVLDIRGQVIPIWQLSTALKLRSEKSTILGQTVLLSHYQSTTFGVAVDRLLNQQQIVVKPIGHEVPNKALYMGSSILGDGLPSLIIDLQRLYQGRLKGLVEKQSNQTEVLQGVA